MTAICRNVKNNLAKSDGMWHAACTWVSRVPAARMYLWDTCRAELPIWTHTCVSIYIYELCMLVALNCAVPSIKAIVLCSTGLLAVCWKSAWTRGGAAHTWWCSLCRGLCPGQMLMSDVKCQRLIFCSYSFSFFFLFAVVVVVVVVAPQLRGK